MYGSSTLISQGAAGTTTFNLPSAGFSGTEYLGPPDPNTGLGTSTGFSVEAGATVILAFTGTYTGQTVVHEQSLDASGATGWFPVVGYAVDGSGSGSGVSTSGIAYAFPVMGFRHRVRVTALSTGTLSCFAMMDSYPSVAIVSGTSGGSVTPTKPGALTPLGYQQIVGPAAATTLTVPAGATIAEVTVEGASVRWRDDGTAPTVSVGMPLAIGTFITFTTTLSALQFIQTAATATLDISYYK